MNRIHITVCAAIAAACTLEPFSLWRSSNDATFSQLRREFGTPGRYTTVRTALVGVAQSATTFKARLSVVPIDFTTALVVTGSGSATAILTGNKLSITGTFEGLSSPATFAKIHDAPRGIRGQAVWDVAATKDTSGTIKASLELTPTEIEHLRQGRYYIQIHSEKAPDGNLWGWLLAEEQRR